MNNTHQHIQHIQHPVPGCIGCQDTGPCPCLPGLLQKNLNWNTVLVHSKRVLPSLLPGRSSATPRPRAPGTPRHPEDTRARINWLDSLWYKILRSNAQDELRDGSGKGRRGDVQPQSVSGGAMRATRGPERAHTSALVQLPALPSSARARWMCCGTRALLLLLSLTPASGVEGKSSV